MNLKKKKGEKKKSILPYPFGKSFVNVHGYLRRDFILLNTTHTTKEKKPHDTTLSSPKPAEVSSLGIQFYILYVLITEFKQ